MNQASHKANSIFVLHVDIVHDGPLRAQFRQRMETDRASMAICGNCEFGPAGAEGPSFTAVQ